LDAAGKVQKEIMGPDQGEPECGRGKTGRGQKDTVSLLGGVKRRKVHAVNPEGGRKYNTMGGWVRTKGTGQQDCGGVLGGKIRIGGKKKKG